MTSLLKELAEKLNISTCFSYGSGERKTVNVGDDELRFFIENMGYKAKNEEDVKHSLERLDKKRWQRVMEAIYVVNVNDKTFDLVLKESELEDGFEVCVALEGSKKY